MVKLLRFHKPPGVLSQFTDGAGEPPRRTLAEFIAQPHVYVAGRLDYASEGLLLLTDDGALQAQISQPRYKLDKTYLVQMEGQPDARDLEALINGVPLRDGTSRFVKARCVAAPEGLPPRGKPLPAHREAISSWLEVTLNTGRNRQVRRTLAALGYPVLRLIRTAIGPWQLEDLTPGEWREEQVNMPRRPTRGRGPERPGGKRARPR